MSRPASVGGDGRLRLFLALRLPEDVLDGLDAWQRERLHGVRLVPREQLHVTLAFLGSRAAGDLEPIAATLRTAAGRLEGTIRLRPERYRETRSVAMLVLGDMGGRATAFAGELHEALEQLGVYRREGRAWLPHVTVARFRQRPGLRPKLPEVRTFVPSDAAAYLSRLHPSGAQYDVLESVALGRADRARVGGE
jgi:2'-5' RNA ligase